MTKVGLLLGAIVVIGCGEQKVALDKSASETDSASADFTPLPETITKDFIMGLWAKPHDGRETVKELAGVRRREGVWKVVTTTGPDEREMTNTSEATMTVKMVDRRFQVWQWSDGQAIEYSFLTYDPDAERNRWWGLLPDGFIMEWSGERYLRDLVEWETVKVPGEGVRMTVRETLLTEDRRKLKMAGEIKVNDEVVAYRKDDFTWVSELPEGHGLSEAK